MKLIALEEHFWTSAVRDALNRLPADERDKSLALFNTGIVDSRLQDLGMDRLRLMHDIGIDVAGLSLTTPATQSLPSAEAIPLASDANDQLAAAVMEHPDRYFGFATLPTPAPEAAAVELERCVRTLGFKGAMICGRTGAHLLDDPMFNPIFEAAQALSVPIYLHPQIPAPSVQSIYYAGFSEEVNIGLATGGWGWHMETAIIAIRMVLAGVFDRYPTLQVILGHWGEMTAFYLDRIDELSALRTGLQRNVGQYFRENFHVTPSGIFSTPMLLHAIEALGTDRIMFSTDYPFQFKPCGRAREFLENAPLSQRDRDKIAHLNAEHLLRL